MLVDRVELERRINLLITEYRSDKEITKSIEEKLYESGVQFGMKLLTRQVPIETQPMSILYLLSKHFYMYTHEEKIKPSKFFTEVEMEEFKDFKMQNEEDEEKNAFKNFLQMDEDRWNGYLDIKQIAKLWERGIATYNKETQRNTILTKFQGSIIEEINLNKNAVNEIVKAIKDKKFYPVSPIVFNILRDGNDDFEYVNGELRHYEGQFNCVDGFHRSMGILNAIVDMPNLTLNFPVVITNFDVTKAKQMIAQEEKKNVMDQNYTKTLEDTYANAIVRELNARTGEMQSKITHDESAIKYQQAYVMHEVLASAIEENFKIQSERDVRKISDFLVKGFNEIIGIFINDFNDIELSKKYSVTTFEGMFIGYVALLGSLYGKNNWIEKLENTLENLNISTNNETWNEIGIFAPYTNINKKTVKTISKYFKALN